MVLFVNLKLAFYLVDRETMFGALRERRVGKELGRRKHEMFRKTKTRIRVKEEWEKNFEWQKGQTKMSTGEKGCKGKKRQGRCE